MNKELLEKNKAALAKEKNRLEELLSNIGTKDDKSVRENFNSKFPNMGDTMDDNAHEVAAFESSLGEEKVLEMRLRKVNSALERIAAGSYGKCLVGGEDIEEKRLEVAPEVETCVNHSN